ncbi:hypothetical protein GGS24DRAFT_13174 [Hypoxylon argillaceum]|nr:hypothetical protein GGS24DRAFT_13174 [Hypoxylon argillaceum]
MLERQKQADELEFPEDHLRASAQAGGSRKRKRAELKNMGNSIVEYDSEGNESQDANHPDKPATSSYCILYRVVCSAVRDWRRLKIYLDEPRRVARSGVHLKGNNLVRDLDDFLQGRKEVAFIVYRDYFCCQDGIPSSLHGPWTDRSGKYCRELLSVVSEDLYATMQRSSKFAPNQDAYKLDRVEPEAKALSQALSLEPSEYSHQFLYHHRTELGKEAATATEGSAIKALSSYIWGNPSDLYSKCDNLFSQGLVSHDTLSWLFRPNTVIVASKGRLAIAYVLRGFLKEGSQLNLNCWNWGYDGHRLHRVDTSISVDVPTHGTVHINELVVYPLRFAAEETRKRLLDNGEKFWNLRHQSFVSYEGPDYKGERTYPSDSRCMLDYQMYHKFHPTSDAFAFSDKKRTTYDQWPDFVSNSSSLRPIEMILLPPSIHAFFMKENKWVHLLVAQIQPVNWNKAAFDRLVLPKRTKNMIKGLVMARKLTPENPGVQISLKKKWDDIIAGKGSGLTMLLRGGPGTGKTLTAGNVAELAEMPLYSVTCGDIGTSPEAVEKYLNSALYLGKKWNCVLLLDDADVFLEERSLQDLERNSLVSVFLRTLERYDGILILTSNRVGTFDEAIKSRIQLALRYPPLDAPSRLKIWRNFLDILSADNEDIDADDILAHMDTLTSYEMNGRQICNVLTTARQLALFEQETLDWDRIKDSIEVAGDFNKHLM